MKTHADRIPDLDPPAEVHVTDEPIRPPDPVRLPDAPAYDARPAQEPTPAGQEGADSRGAGPDGGPGGSAQGDDRPGSISSGPRAYRSCPASMCDGSPAEGRDGAIGRLGAATFKTEGAVMKALRWLKKEQKPDGSWDTPPVAMTGFALLCYLATGDARLPRIRRDRDEGHPVPGVHAAELAQTVRVGHRHLRHQRGVRHDADPDAEGGRDAGRGGHCTGPAADRRVVLRPDATDEADDTSVMGWCVQALKAAQLAGIRHEGLENAMRLAVRAFKSNASPGGGFGYRSPGEGGLTGVGVLCMQLLGAANQSEAQRGLVWLERASCRWTTRGWGAPLLLVLCHPGQTPCRRDLLERVNQQFASELVRNQVVLSKAGADGKDIGFWDLPRANGVQVKDHSTGLAYNTTLCWPDAGGVLQDAAHVPAAAAGPGRGRRLRGRLISGLTWQTEKDTG